MIELTDELHLVGATKSQLLQLGYYKQAVFNYNKKIIDDSKKLTILITPYILKALIFAFKNLMDLPGTIEALNNYQIDKQKEHLSKISEESKKTLVVLLDKIEETEDKDVKIAKVEDTTSVCTVSQVMESPVPKRTYVLTEPLVELDVKDINIEYEGNMKLESLKELQLFLVDTVSDLDIQTIVCHGDFVKYESSVSISGNCGEVLHVEDSVGAFAVQDSINSASNLALSYVLVNKNFLGKNNYDDKLTSKELLESFLEEEGITIASSLGQDKFVITLDNHFSYVTYDVTVFGQEDLYDKIVVALGLVSNEDLDPYYSMVNFKLTENKIHRNISFSKSLRYFSVFMDGLRDVFDGLTIHHCLSYMFANCDDSYFCEVVNVSDFKRLVHITDSDFIDESCIVSGYIRYVSDFSCIWPFGFRNGLSNMTLTYEGIEFVMFINEMYSLRGSRSYDFWKEFVVEQFRQKQKIFGNIDIDYYLNRSNRRRLKYLL